MMDIVETAAIIRAILSSRKCTLSISQLNRDFKNETGFDIPVFGYGTLSGFLHSLVQTLKVEGLYPIEKVSLIKNEKSGHIVSLVMRQKNPGNKYKGLSKSAAPNQPEGGSPADKRMRPRRAFRKEMDKEQANQKKKILENEGDARYTFPLEEETYSFQNFQKSFLPEKENRGFVKRSLTPEDEYAGYKCYEGYIFKSPSPENEMVNRFKKPVPHKTETGGEQRGGSSTKKFSKPNVETGIMDSHWVKWPTSHRKSHEEYYFKTLSAENEGGRVKEPAPHGNKSTNSFKEHASPGKKQIGDIQKSTAKKEIDDTVQGAATQPIEAIFKPSVLKKLRKSSIEELNPCERIPYLNLSQFAKTGSYGDIRLCKVYSPHHFYFCLKKFEIELIKLLNQMMIFYSVNRDIAQIPHKDIKVGQICAVYYKKLGTDELIWHRAEIRAVQGRLVIVTLVDCGNVAEVLYHQVKYLYGEFGQLPRQAILGNLAHIRPPNTQKYWTNSTNRRFINLTCERDMITRVVSISSEDHVSMTLTNTVDKLHINDVLVAEGLARYDHTSPDLMLAESFSRCLSSITEGTQTQEEQTPKGKIAQRKSLEESEEDEDDGDNKGQLGIGKKQSQTNRNRGKGKGRGNIRMQIQ